MRQIRDFVKRETVLTAALALAAVSAVVVRPDAAYLGYVAVSYTHLDVYKRQDPGPAP